MTIVSSLPLDQQSRIWKFALLDTADWGDVITSSVQYSLGVDGVHVMLMETVLILW